MKRIILFSLMAMFTLTAFAQGSKSLKEASKVASDALSNPLTAGDALSKAKMLLEEAFQDESVASSPKSWVTKGDILLDVAEGQINATLINPEAELVDPMAPSAAIEAYIKALELSIEAGDKKSKKNSLKGLNKAENIANNTGVTLYQKENFKGAYETFRSELAANTALSANGESSRLDDAAVKSEKNYFAGLTAYYAEDFEGANTYLGEALSTGTSEAVLYQLLYESNNKLEKKEEALSFLTKGREMFPDDSGLLFSEINYYLAAGELEIMIGKLEEALAKEPDNTSVVLTLGQVYDQLQAKSTEDGDLEKAQEYMNSAKQYYEDALTRDADNFDINYALGALYYNKAASYTPALNAAAEDFSAAGTKKYDEIKGQMSENFDLALPFFLKADSVNDQDRNTLIALKEIYVRKDDFTKSDEYKARLEALEE